MGLRSLIGCSKFWASTSCAQLFSIFWAAASCITFRNGYADRLLRKNKKKKEVHSCNVVSCTVTCDYNLCRNHLIWMKKFWHAWPQDWNGGKCWEKSLVYLILLFILSFETVTMAPLTQVKGSRLIYLKLFKVFNFIRFHNK